MVSAAVASEIINRRQRQLVVHAIIYYGFNDNIIGDSTYDAWSKELAELMRDYPIEAAQAPLADMFYDFDGSTGFQLVGRAREQQRSRAESLLRYHITRRTNK